MKKNVLPYDIWVAAKLFADSGTPLPIVCDCLGISQDAWEDANGEHAYLQSADRWWWRTSWPNASYDPAYLEFVTHGRWKIGSGDANNFRLGAALEHIRQQIYQNPRIGPFVDVDWVAHFIAEHYQLAGVIYSHNERDVFFRGKPLWNKSKEPITDIDACSFRMLGDRWMCDKNRVYAQGQHGSKIASLFFYVVEGADVDSFQEVNERYAVDKNAAYYITNKRLKADPKTFAIIPLHYVSIHGEDDVDSHGSHHARDADNVWAYGIKITDIQNPAGFHQIGEPGLWNGGYFTDGYGVWYESKRIEGADVSSFIVAGRDFGATDKNRPYDREKPELNLTEHDWKHWRDFFEGQGDRFKNYWWWQRTPDQIKSPMDVALPHIGGNYYGDKQRIYIKSAGEEFVPLTDLDASSFEYLMDSACKDKNGMYSFCVYYGSRFIEGGKIKHGDPETLAALDYGWYADKNNAYRTTWIGIWKAVAIDRSTFEPLSQGYARDAKGVIYLTTRKQNVDPQNVRAIGHSYLVLGNGELIYRGKTVKRLGAFDIHTASPYSLNSDEILIDSNGNVMLGRKMLRPGIDKQSFRVLNRAFGVDDQAAYYFNGLTVKRLKKADRQSITPDESDAFTAHDKNNTYRHVVDQGDKKFGLEITARNGSR